MFSMAIWTPHKIPKWYKYWSPDSNPRCTIFWLQEPYTETRGTSQSGCASFGSPRARIHLDEYILSFFCLTRVSLLLPSFHGVQFLLRFFNEFLFLHACTSYWLLSIPWHLLVGVLFHSHTCAATGFLWIFSFTFYTSLKWPTRVEPDELCSRRDFGSVN